MRFDTQKAFPYPVLRPFSDDYETSEFQAVVQPTYVPGEEKVTLKASFAMSSKELRELIAEGSATYSVVLSCRDTYFRRALASREDGLEAEFRAGDVFGEVEIQSYVVAIRDIDGFSSNDISDEFGPGPFSFHRGAVLAMEEPCVFYFERDVFRPVTSVFDIVQDDSLDGGRWKVQLDDDRVQIALSPKMKSEIDDARNTKKNKVILINSVYFSAVAHTIQVLKESNDYDGYRWAETIRRQCHNQSIELDSKDAYVIAQILLKSPLGLLDEYVFRGEK